MTNKQTDKQTKHDKTLLKRLSLKVTKRRLKGYPKAIFKSPLSCIQAHLESNNLTFKGGGGRKTWQKKFRLSFQEKILAQRTGIKTSPVCLRKHFRTPKTVFALQKPLFAVRNLLFALHKLLSYFENYIIYFGKDFLYYKSIILLFENSLLYFKITCIHFCICQELLYMWSDVDVKFLHPPCLNENMSSGIFKKYIIRPQGPAKNFCLLQK